MTCLFNGEVYSYKIDRGSPLCASTYDVKKSRKVQNSTHGVLLIFVFLTQGNMCTSMGTSLEG